MKSKMVFLLTLLILLVPFLMMSQQPQTGTAPIYAVNAKYTNGVAPGYWPTAGAGLVLNVSAGTANCANSIVTYAGGTLTLTNSTTNYVYLNVASSCVPAFNTSGFTATTIPIATVVTSGGAITSITDDRSPFYAPSVAGTGTVTSVATTSPLGGGTITTVGTLTCSTCIIASSPSAGLLRVAGGTQTATSAEISGDGSTSGSNVFTLSNIPTGVTAAGTIIHTNIAAPSSPSAGHDSTYTDSTDLRFHDKNASGVIGTTVVADTGTSNNFLTAISAAGAISKARPTCANLSDSTASCSTDATNASNISSGTLATGRLATGINVRSFGTTFGDTTGSALTSGSVVYFTVPYACTITAWNITVDAGTVTFDIWKIATGSAIPTVSNAITASAKPALASGTALHSTSMSGWTTAVTANDIFGIKLDTVATAKYAELDIQCNQ